MSDMNLIEDLLIKVEGEKKNQDIKLFTLSTCMWCKKSKRYFEENNVEYSYIDMDKIQPNHKIQILDFLKNTYKERISYPFIVCGNKAFVGYDPNKFDEIITNGGDLN